MQFLLTGSCSDERNLIKHVGPLLVSFTLVMVTTTNRSEFSLL